MSEHQQQETHSVGIGEFIASMKFSVTAEELSESVRETDAHRRFILRLLDPGGTEAFDRFVEIVAADDIASDTSRESLLVSVRPVWPDGKTGKIEPPYPVDSDGIIPDKAAIDLDRGYFVDVPDMDAAEFYHSQALSLRQPLKQAPPLKYFEAEPPSSEEQHRYYG